MDEDLGPWLKHKDSLASTAGEKKQLMCTSPPFSLRTRVRGSPVDAGTTPQPSRQHSSKRTSHNASLNTKLDYYRKNSSAGHAHPIVSESIRSPWVPRSKLQSHTPVQHHAIAKSEKDCEVRGSRSFSDLRLLLELSAAKDRTAVYRQTHDIDKAVNWPSRQPVVLPPLIKSYKRRTPPHRSRATRPRAQYKKPSRFAELQLILHSQQMSPRV